MLSARPRQRLRRRREDDRDTDVAALSYEAVAIRHSDWGVPGQGLTVFVIEPSPAVLGFQARLLAAITPFLGSGATSAAYVRDEGETIGQSTMDWVEGYVPNQIGAKYIAHITLGFATLEDLKVIEAEPFDAVHGARRRASPSTASATTAPPESN